MSFRAWYLEQSPGVGEHLDKDFLGDGKLYSPKTCYFVPAWLNSLFNDSGSIRGNLPQGVSLHKLVGKYQAQIKIKCKVVSLGYFDTPEEASAVYLKAKAVYVEDLLVEFPQPPRLVAAVRRKMAELIQSENKR